MTVYEGQPSAAGGRIALVCSRFNQLIVDRLELGARQALCRSGLDDGDIDTYWVPGALEIPIAAKAIIDAGRHAAVVALGVVLRGDTYHFEVVANESAAGLMALAGQSGAIVTNGILTLDTLEQALDRAGGKVGNKGAEAASAALEMIDLRRQIAGA